MNFIVLFILTLALQYSFGSIISFPYHDTIVPKDCQNCLDSIQDSIDNVTRTSENYWDLNDNLTINNVTRRQFCCAENELIISVFQMIGMFQSNLSVCNEQAFQSCSDYYVMNHNITGCGQDDEYYWLNQTKICDYNLSDFIPSILTESFKNLPNQLIGKITEKLGICYHKVALDNSTYLMTSSKSFLNKRLSITKSSLITNPPLITKSFQLTKSLRAAASSTPSASPRLKHEQSVCCSTLHFIYCLNNLFSPNLNISFDRKTFERNIQLAKTNFITEFCSIDSIDVLKCNNSSVKLTYCWTIIFLIFIMILK